MRRVKSPFLPPADMSALPRVLAAALTKKASLTTDPGLTKPTPEESAQEERRKSSFQDIEHLPFFQKMLARFQGQDAQVVSLSSVSKL